jgi:hypothetical protein
MRHACPSAILLSNRQADKHAGAVQRRLLIGVGLTVALGAFALVPTDALRIDKPSKPLYLYLIPLMRIQVCPRSVAAPGGPVGASRATWGSTCQNARQHGLQGV